jgi:aryl-alcohol dehydrogenase-like predicted oxidoreductase
LRQDTPAWVVSKCNQYANDHGKTPFSIYQGNWNVLNRSFEREIISMARSEGKSHECHRRDLSFLIELAITGLALAPWNVLAGGKLRTDAEEERRRVTGEQGRTVFGSWERNEQEKNISAALEKVAKEVGTEHITAGKSLSMFRQRSIAIKALLVCAVAIAYVMQKAPYVFPIVGGRKVEHLLGNIEALSISLSPEQIAYLESIIPFDPGFPTSMIVRRHF